VRGVAARPGRRVRFSTTNAEAIGVGGPWGGGVSLKRAAVVVLAVASFLVGGVSVASAENVCTAAGCTSVNEGGYVVVLDGDAANPDPGDGFISVSDAPQVCADDNGTADDGNLDNGPESTSPTCNP
jgi:hypothetical protein